MFSKQTVLDSLIGRKTTPSPSLAPNAGAFYVVGFMHPKTARSVHSVLHSCSTSLVPQHHRAPQRLRPFLDTSLSVAALPLLSNHLPKFAQEVERIPGERERRERFVGIRSDTVRFVCWCCCSPTNPQATRRRCLMQSVCVLYSLRTFFSLLFVAFPSLVLLVAFARHRTVRLWWSRFLLSAL